MIERTTRGTAMSSKKSVPGPSKSEMRHEQTNTIAREIIAQETRARDEKTARLRAARLARDAAERAQSQDAPAKTRTPAKKKTAKA
ncbi:hypothetical protein LVO79_05850 [Roseivivax marinus]|uniref:hypothetical protein n=1 Tax=Roseivivax marinus TaxID=1379903 RepID=UPI001F03D0AD|nr:hypothetical protein [Roseivivax marinus]UMA65970.1 hypothetical protein LVO79_05850 [Roseivivax marinus]